VRLSHADKIRHAEEICRHAKDLTTELENVIEDLIGLHERFSLEKAEDAVASMIWVKEQIDEFKTSTNRPLGALIDDDIIDG
jgi:hypothetical protein